MGDRELEILERIIDMLTGAGEGAFWIAIAWIGQGYFVPILVVASVLVLAVLVAHLIRDVLVQKSVTAGAWEDLRREAGINECWSWSVLSEEKRRAILSEDKRRVMELVRRGLEAEEKEND